MSDQKVLDAWDEGDPYEQYIGRWSRRVALQFLTWLGIPAGRRWLDVGTGTGAVCAAIADNCSPALLIGVEPSEGFLRTAEERLAGRASLRHGSATAIPAQNSSVDVVVSGLVLNFVPDPHAAVIEAKRVTAEGGTIGAYVWDYAQGMELIRIFWEAAAELDSGAVGLDEGIRFPLCRPEALEQLFVDADLADVEVQAITVPTPFQSFADYWDPFLGGQGPAPAYVMSLDADLRDALRQCLQERLPTQSDGSILLNARSWAVRGIEAK